MWERTLDQPYEFAHSIRTDSLRGARRASSSDRFQAVAMHLDQLRTHLQSPDQARPLLHAWTVRDMERGWSNLSHLAQAVGLDALQELSQPLGRILPRCPVPDMALNNLERFLANPAGAQQLPLLIENRAR